MRTMLVTGGAGFIGGNFVRQVLSQTDWGVVNVDNLTYAGNLESLASVMSEPRHIFVRGDISDRTLIQGLLDRHGCQAVVNFAAESHVDRSITTPGSFVQTNVVGTFELLEAALRHWQALPESERDQFRFLHVSTDEVYGSLGPEGHFSEESRYEPNSPYSASKAASDHFVRAYHKTYGLPAVTTNCSNNYGPYQFPEKLIPLTILNAWQGKPLPVYGQGENVRDWLHVEDHCRAIRMALESGRPGEVYNIGGKCELTNLDVVRTICRVVDRLCPKLAHRPCEGLIQFVTDRPGHDFRYAIDSSKIERELGWRQEIDFTAGIEATVRWYLDHGSWIENVRSRGYSGERLGLRDVQVELPESTGDSGQAGSPVEVTQEIDGVEMAACQRYTDERGWLTELFRTDEMTDEARPMMAYVSETSPGVARGPHEHVHQTDYFAFIGPGDFRMYLWDSRPGSPTQGNRIVKIVGESNPMTVLIPPGIVHAYQNIGQSPGLVFNAPNRLYAGPGKKEPVDEIRHEDDADSPFVLIDG
ncbi:MAG: dTDP-glucose 4,6-dehydratase [Planctomycetales bacterium]|nr:dTDP-glucose 4,6-dehydratase [Planctomycetales bacterium]